MNTFIAIFFLMSICISCSDTDIPPNSTNKKGTLIAPSLSFDLDIETGNFSKKQKVKDKLQSRTTGNDVNNFVVEILTHPEREIVKTFENYSELVTLGKVELEEGNYTLKVYNDDFPSFPSSNYAYFLGESEVFAITFEETTEIDDLVIKTANTKISVSFSDNIPAQFESYEVEITSSDNSKKVSFKKDIEPKSVYFSSSYDLSIVGGFHYTKTNGTKDVKLIHHEIKNIKAGVEYKINISVVLENGELIFKLILDDSFEEETIDLGNGSIVDVDNIKYIPKELPVITSPLNTFEENTTTTYNLTWEPVKDATHYTVYHGSRLTSDISEYASSLTAESLTINLLEGSNFFKIKAHFSDDKTTEYIGGNFRKYPSSGRSNFYDEITPKDGETYNGFQSDIIVNDDHMMFRAIDNTGGKARATRLHQYNTDNGKVVKLSDGFTGNINEEIDINNGGLLLYYYSSGNSDEPRFGVRFDNEYHYFTAILDPKDKPYLFQKSLSIPATVPVIVPAIVVRLNFRWGYGTAYFYIEKREQGTTTWKNVNNGWHTSTDFIDHDVEKGKTYEYRFKMNNTKDFIRASEFSPIGAITVQ